MTKGVSAIIAMVLIVLITISLAGTFLIWTQRTATQLSEKGTEEGQRFTTQFDKGVQILSHDCSQATGSDFAYVKNTGKASWTAADLTFLVNDTLNSSVINFDSYGAIAQNGIVKATFNQSLEKGYTIRVTYQEVSDSVVCG